MKKIVVVLCLLIAGGAHALPVTILGAGFDGYWKVGNQPIQRGSRIVDVAPGTHSFSIGVDDSATITVDAAGNVSSSHPSLIASGSVLTLNTVSAGVDAGAYQGFYNFYLGNVGWLAGTSSVNLVPGFTYRLFIGIADSVYVTLDQSGHWQSGHAALTASGSQLIMNTVPVSVDTGAYTGIWGMNRAVSNRTGNALVDLPVDIRYRLLVANYGQHDFDLLADGTVSLLNNVTLSAGQQWLAFNTESVSVDPAQFLGDFGIAFGPVSSEGVPLTAELPPGVRYHVSVSGTDEFAVDLRPGGIWQIAQGQSADASGTVLTLRNEAVTITPDGQAAYQISGTSDWLTGQQALALVPDIRYQFINGAMEQRQFELLPPCLPSPDTIQFSDLTLQFECGIVVLDQDGDGIPDANDNCPALANADQLDFDGDGFGNACDADLDGDGVLNLPDNCEFDANPDQADLDGDGLGDVCDDDVDGDTVPDGDDNCPLTPNFSQADLDLDDIGDACDPDIDGDLFNNGVDNCPNVVNADQIDTDGDGEGDACDGDQDGDGVANESDICPATELGASVTTAGCSGEQWLEAQCQRDTFRNHGQYMRCVAQTSEDLVETGVWSEEEKDAAVSREARSR